MVFNSLSKSLDGTSSILDVLSNGNANHIAITNENPNLDSAEKLASFDRSNKISTRHDVENDFVASVNILDSPYNYKTF